MASQKIRIGRYSIEVTHPDRILFPESSITKEDLIHYYTMVSSAMVPYLRNRLLSMQRWPQGIEHEGFFQKNAPEGFPSWIKTITVSKLDKEEGATQYVVCNNAATIVYLVNYGCITFHTSLNFIDKLNYPDRMIFDLDPSVDNFQDVLWAAFELKALLKDLNLIPFAMTTGSRGVHVVVPLVRRYPFEQVEAFAHACARMLVDKYPKKLTLAFYKKSRAKKIFIDTLRNQYGAISVAPYSVRAKEGAPVAMPVSWSELKTLKSSQDFTIINASRYLTHSMQAWKKIFTSSSSLPLKKVNL